MAYHPQIQVFARAARWPVASYGEQFFSLTPAMIRELRQLSYMEQWRTALKNQWYHILLEDHSLVMFNETADAASFSFLHCPVDAPTFQSFLESINEEHTAKNRQKYSDDYRMVLDTASARQNVTPIRFDYDEKGYRCGAHPVSHIHIGLDNQIRIGVDRRLSATSFILFVMRQHYPECWERVLGHQEGSRLPKALRIDCPSINAKYWQNSDQIELHLK